MRRWKFYCGLVLGVGLTLFALSNLQATPVYLLVWYVRAPLILTVAASAASGAVWASLWITFARRRKRRQATDTSAFSDEAPQPVDGAHRGS